MVGLSPTGPLPRRPSKLAWPRSLERGKCFPERENALDSSIRRQLDDCFASRACGSIEPNDGATHARGVQKDVQTRVQDQTTTGPVSMEPGNLLRDLLIASEHAYWAPDLRAGGHCHPQELQTVTFIVLGEGLLVRVEDTEELRLVHADRRK